MTDLSQHALTNVTLFPFWLDNPEAPSVEPQLIGRTQADLLVVGGGFTGLWAAIQAKEADPGRDVVLIEGSKVAYGASGRPGGYERLAGAFFKTFPQLGDLRSTHAWSGPIALTTRMAVHIQRYYGNKAIYAGGYSGFGVSASRFGARLGLALLDGLDLPECKLDLATSMPNRIPPEPFRWIGSTITMYALDTADEKGGWRRP